MIGLGMHAPPKTLTNKTLETLVATSASWITARTGTTLGLSLFPSQGGCEDPRRPRQEGARRGRRDPIDRHRLHGPEHLHSLRGRGGGGGPLGGAGGGGGGGAPS